MNDHINEQTTKESVEPESGIAVDENANTKTEPSPSEDTQKNIQEEEQQPTDTQKSWNSINASINAKKAPIKGKDASDKPREKFFEDLAQRFVNQQDQVINHRNHLLSWFAWITASQLLVINVLIFICVFSNHQILGTLLSFMKFFVGATFLELLGGLLIIVKYVFSHETYDMLKHLTYIDPAQDN